MLMERRERSDRSGISTAKSEFVWGDATEGTVGAVAVVVLAVRVSVGSGVSHVLEKEIKGVRPEWHCREQYSVFTWIF